MRWLLVALSLLASLAALPVSAAANAGDQFTFEAAQSSFPASGPQAPPVDQGLDPRDRVAVEYQIAQDTAYLKIIFVVSGVAVAFLLFTLWLSARPSHPLTGKDVLRAAVVVFIAYGGIVLALAYPKNETMTGVIGILSAIAGYVFGRSGGEDRGEVTTTRSGAGKP